jgi:hypothetical protein
MIDLFETIIKMHTVVVMGEYFKRNELSEMAKGMLAYGLQTPSLGTWQKFSRDLCSELISNNHPFVLNYFKDEFLLFDKSNNDKTNIISFRNRYAHGATPTDKDCEADIIQFEPFLLKLLASKWLYESQLIIIDNLVFIQSKTTLEKLNLHPILVCKEETNGQPFTFFNDIKDEKVGLLNYPLSKHYREQKTYIEEFYAILPLKEWKQNVSNEFKQYIEELTEGFKGRIMELKTISTFIATKDKGYLSIQGNPGIGKSALIAQVSRELNKSEYNKRYKLCEYFIRRGTRSDNNINLLNHLLKTTDIYYPEGKSIMPEGNSNWDLQKALFAKWNAFGNGGPKFKLIFLIDGLDEGVENDILNYLPRENFKNILFIYGSRHGGHLKLASFWTELPIENHETILLGGLNKEDIRAFLYEVVNKYEIDQIWIDEILNRSEGNPLYLKLLCYALENGSIEINNSKALPKEIDSYYKAILDRYAQQTDGDALIECLLLFAVAEDYLTPAHLGIMNSMSIASQQRVMNILTEVLYENPQTDFVLDYQLFHESFREYLIKTYPLEIKKANHKIINSCQKWQELEILFEQRYVLEHYATHLVKSATVENKEVLVELSKNAAFQKTQNQVLRNYNANYSLLRAALLAASELNQKEDVIEIGLCLVDLQYEEKNDVQSIIDMVANNEMELALQRIESFGGNDREDLQQKFILYMLCFMELTLLESKNKPFRKEAIEKLLKHFDENLPVDHSVLNWNDIFSSYLIFQMACEFAQLGLDYLVIYKRTEYLEIDWIIEKGPYHHIQIEVLTSISGRINHLFSKSLALKVIAEELAKQGQLQESVTLLLESITIARCIKHEDDKIEALIDIAEVYAKKGEIQKFSALIEEALNIAHGINRENFKSRGLKHIAVILAKQGQLDESITIASSIVNENYKSEALKEIALALAKQGLLNDSLKFASGITDGFIKSEVLKEIAVSLSKQGQIEKSEVLIEESLNNARGLSSDSQKCRALMEIALVLLKQGQTEKSESLISESLIIAYGISNGFQKNQMIMEITIEMAKQQQFEKSLIIAHSKIEEEFGYKIGALNGIALELSKNGQQQESTSLIQESLILARKITDRRRKSWLLKDIAVGLAKNSQFEELVKTMKVSLIKERGIYDISDKSGDLKILALALFEKRKLLESKLLLKELINKSREIYDEYEKIGSLKDIAIILAKQGQLQESTSLIQETLTIARGINGFQNSRSLMDIAIALAKQGQLDESINIAREISLEHYKSRALKFITIALSEQEEIEESLVIARGIRNENHKSEALKDIAFVCSKKGQIEKSAVLIEESLNIARGISEEFEKSKAIIDIAVVLAKQDKKEKSGILIEESINIARGISRENDKFNSLKHISIKLAGLGQLELSSLLIQESLFIARLKSIEDSNNWPISGIAIELAIQGNFIFAEQIGNEIPEMSVRYLCWMDLAKNTIENLGWNTAFKQFSQFQSREAKMFFLKGIAEHISIIDATDECLRVLIPLLSNDNQSIEILLQKYSIMKLFMEKVSTKEEDRLNKTLNIQWAIDIAAKFEKEFERASHNIQEWINEIKDENDREDILSWAEKVKQGKMTEEKFLDKINKL